jgi:hypothetical protein
MCLTPIQEGFWSINLNDCKESTVSFRFGGDNKRKAEATHFEFCVKKAISISKNCHEMFLP